MKKGNKRLLAFICAITMMLGLLSGCGGKTPSEDEASNSGKDPSTATDSAETVSYKETLTVARIDEIKNGDPYFRNATPERYTCTLTHDSLLYFNYETNKLEPYVAKEWKDVNGDAKTWEFKLNEGIQFHDGEGNPFGELTSADVKFTWEYAGQGGTGNVGYSIGGYTYVDSIECPDDYTVVFHLNKPAYDFDVMNSGNTKILCAKAFEEYDDPITAAEVGSGPYYLNYAESMEGTHWTVTRFEDYWRGTEDYPSKNICFRKYADANSCYAAMEAGEAECMFGMNATLTRQAEGNPNIVVEAWEGSANTFIAFNYINSYDEEDSLPLRQAVAHAIDRDALIAVYYQGMDLGSPSHAFAIESTMGYVELENPYPYDVEKAREIMKGLGYDENNRMQVKFGYKIGDQPIIEFIQAALKEIYIDADCFVIEATNHSAFLREGIGWDMTMNYVAVSPNMFYDFNRILHSDGNSNGMYGFHSEEYEALQESAQNGSSYDETLERFTELQQWVVDNIPFVQTHIPKYVFAYTSNVEGVRPAPTAQSMDIQQIAARE